MHEKKRIQREDDASFEIHTCSKTQLSPLSVSVTVPPFILHFQSPIFGARYTWRSALVQESCLINCRCIICGRECDGSERTGDIEWLSSSYASSCARELAVNDVLYTSVLSFALSLSHSLPLFVTVALHQSLPLRYSRSILYRSHILCDKMSNG